jgi:hypothetical protein
MNVTNFKLSFLITLNPVRVSETACMWGEDAIVVVRSTGHVQMAYSVQVLSAEQCQHFWALSSLDGRGGRGGGVVPVICRVLKGDGSHSHTTGTTLHSDRYEKTAQMHRNDLKNCYFPFVVWSPLRTTSKWKPNFTMHKNKPLPSVKCSKWVVILVRHLCNHYSFWN